MLSLTLLVVVAQRCGYLTKTRLLAHNLLTPTRSLLLSITSHSDSPANSSSQTESATSGELSELQNALLENELQRRQLLIENAQLRYQLQTLRSLADVNSMTDHDLIKYSGRTAQILSSDGTSHSLKEAIIAAGKAHGISTSQLVVSGDGIVLDKGTIDGFDAGQKVTVGAAVIGRIDQVSRWVSLVQPVTDADFSAAVQLVKAADHGASFGPNGLLEGTGEDTCRVTGIPYTEAVAVGDHVFSADINGMNGPRLYYGIVTQADFSPGGEWIVKVAPALPSRRSGIVTVIQAKADPPERNQGSVPSSQHSAIRTQQ